MDEDGSRVFLEEETGARGWRVVLLWNGRSYRGRHHDLLSRALSDATELAEELKLAPPQLPKAAGGQRLD